MGRGLRVIYPGAIYHVIQRGNNKSYIFATHSDKQQFLDIVVKSMAIYDFHILYYVLMDNHYHLVVETGSIPVDKIMQWINVTYTRYYNKQYNRVGTLYGGRYSGSVILNDLQLRRVIRYIAYNPVRAEMVSVPGQYRWCAHSDLENRFPQSIISQNRLLGYFGTDLETAWKNYRESIEKPERGIRPVGSVEPISYTSIIMDSEKIGLSTEDALDNQDYPDDPLEHDHWEDIASSVEDYLSYLLDNQSLQEIDKINIRSGQCPSLLKPHRNAFIQKACDEGYALKDIARFLSISYETTRRVALME